MLSMYQRTVIEQLVVEQRLILCVAQFHGCKLSRIPLGHCKGEYQEYQLTCCGPSLAGAPVDCPDIWPLSQHPATAEKDQVHLL